MKYVHAVVLCSLTLLNLKIAFYPTKTYCHDHFSSFFLLFFFYSVYIFLSSANIVALDDHRGKFKMDL